MSIFVKFSQSRVISSEGTYSQRIALEHYSVKLGKWGEILPHKPIRSKGAKLAMVDEIEDVIRPNSKQLAT